MRDFSHGLRLRPVLFLLVLSLSVRPAGAGWTSRPAAGGAGADAAGLAEGGAEAIRFTCAGQPKGRARLVFGGFEAGLQRDLDRTVVVTVDGTAYRQTTRAEADPGTGGSDLARSAAIAELAGLIAALKSGSKAEIASPAGRRTIALKGSGKALAAFEAGCR